ncbi:hypothetical protein HDU82_000213 [Entophlyctis luteolus]|nr:hypothetical protein HDU82_000213 [Entophlyctis luteolus]
MAAFWQNGQVLNDLGATFGDLHSASNKSIVASGNTNGSVALTFGAASQYVFADFNSYGSCNEQLGLNYDGVHLVVAAQSIGVTFDVKVQMFADDTCTVVDGNKDVVFHSADMNKFTLANQYESFAIPFTTAGINRTRVKDWMITNVQPAGSVLDIGCSSLYQGSVPATGPVDAVIAAESSSSTQAMSTASATSAASQSNAVDSAQNTLPVLSITLGLIFGVVGVYSGKMMSSWCLLLWAAARGVWAGCSVCRGLSIVSPCVNPPDMAVFSAMGQVPDDLGATFGDLHSVSNKSITTSGDTAGSVSFTFGAASQYVYADLNIYTTCNASWGIAYDGFQLIIASDSTAASFEIHIQMFQDDTCTTVDGSQDFVVSSGEIAQFTAAFQYESFVVPFVQSGINRTRIKDWLIRNVQPAGTTLMLGCATIYQNPSPPVGPVDLDGKSLSVSSVTVLPSTAVSVTSAILQTTSATDAISTGSSASSSGSSQSGPATSVLLPVILTLVFVVLLLFGCCLYMRNRAHRKNRNAEDENSSED